MRSKIKYTGIVVLVLFAIAALVGFLFRKRIASHYIPQIEQIGIIYIKLDNDTSYVNFKLGVTNKTFLKVDIDTITYKISVFNKTYLEKQRFLGLVLPGSGKDTIQISIKIPYVAILKNLASERSKGDSTSYSVQLYLHCKTLFGKSEIEVNRAAKLKIPQVPELKIESIKWDRVRLKSILAAVTLKLTNHSNISLTIKNLKYDMIVASKGNLKGIYPESFIIKPNTETLVTFPVEINARMLKTAFEILSNKDKYDYTLTIDATLLSMDSLQENFHVNIVNNGIVELKK